MIFRFIICAALAACVVQALEPEEMEAIQDRLDKYELLEEFFRAVDQPEQMRGDAKCLSEGAQCKFASGPNCCGVATRCIVWDTQLPATHRGGSARWLSKCRRYKLGVALEKIGNWFG